MRTCGYCPSSTTAATAANATSATTAVPSWVRNGFCTNSFYTAAHKRQHCARSCNVC
ncbi:shTK domain protein [Cooperia oncophora]